MKQITIPFDRIKLILSALVSLIVFLAMPALCLYVSLDPLLIFFLLTICWFALKAFIRSSKRLIGRKPICICTDKEIQINSMTEKTVSMKWKDIEKIAMKEKTHGVQFILFGANIDHASGVYLIHIDYPFSYKRVEQVKQDMLACFKKHHIPVEPVKKEGRRHAANIAETR